MRQCYYSTKANPCTFGRYNSKPGWPNGYWCYRHYGRWRSNGDPLGGKIDDGDQRRFIDALIDDPPADCVEWPYGLSRGRPMHRLDGRQMGACRAVLILAAGEPPADDMHAAHAPTICHNPMCVNPRHLRWATPAENNADKKLDGTWQGGTNNPSAKLTEEIVDSIRRSSQTTAELARRYGVSDVAVSNARRGKTWRHVKTPPVIN